jgi:hypothetical protein
MKNTKVWDLLESPRNSLNRDIDIWLKKNKSFLTDKNEELNLKVGDVVIFRNGYDVPMSTKIIAFHVETKKAFMLWDCYWADIDLKERIIK